MDRAGQLMPLEVASQMRSIGRQLEGDEAFWLIFVLPIDRASAIQDSNLNHSPWLNLFEHDIQSRNEWPILMHENDLVITRRRTIGTAPKTQLDIFDREALEQRLSYFGVIGHYDFILRKDLKL